MLLSFSYSVPHEACAHTFYVLGGLVNVLLRNALKDAVSLEGVGEGGRGGVWQYKCNSAHI